MTVSPLRDESESRGATKTPPFQPVFPYLPQEIKEVLAFRDRGTYPCPYVLTLINAKVEEIESRIQGLRMLARDLRRLRKAAVSIPRGESAKKARFCHIIENQRLLQPLGRPLAPKKLRRPGP